MGKEASYLIPNERDMSLPPSTRRMQPTPLFCQTYSANGFSDPPDTRIPSQA